MKITLKCKCGALATFSDDRGSFINPGGKYDDQGRKFLVQVDADNWQERHAGCLDRQGPKK